MKHLIQMTERLDLVTPHKMPHLCEMAKLNNEKAHKMKLPRPALLCKQILMDSRLDTSAKLLFILSQIIGYE